MRIREIVRTSFRALVVNKVRSILTMLGVIIGVFAVVSLVSVVQGFQNYISDQFSKLGSNLIIVMPGLVSFQSNSPSHFTNNKLEYKNIDTLNLYLDGDIVAVTPLIEVTKISKYKTKTFNATIIGGNADALKVVNVPVATGKFFGSGDRNAKAKVAMLGSAVVDALFPNRDPLGQSITIDGISFKVIGTAAEWGPNFDNSIFIPDTTIKSSLGIDKFTAIYIKVRDGVDMDQTMRKAKLALRRDLKADDYTVMSQKDILSSIDSILGVLSVALAAIAGISLLVGGIGIMNIMLVSVTERTREIGLRKALGATSRDILLQFLTESIVISVSGGLVGLGLAWGVTLAIQSLLRAEVPWWSVILAFGFSLIVGVVFGTYPAISAAKKDPIEALRYE